MCSPCTVPGWLGTGTAGDQPDVTMAQNVYVGLAVSNRTTSALATATVR